MQLEPRIWATDVLVIGSGYTGLHCALQTAAAGRRTLVIEEREWVRDALTADRASSLQAFRDLFSDQVLRPGDEVAVQRVALLFTDLSASTALYGRIGDAAAMSLIMFAILLAFTIVYARMMMRSEKASA